MSCIQISFETLAGVRETIEATRFWRDDYPDTPCCLFDAFFPNQSIFSITENRVKETAAEFVALALAFNTIELHHGETPYFLPQLQQALAEFHGKRPNIMQFFKSMMFISYNTSAAGWINENEYKSWPMREQYEKFHKTCDRVIKALAVDFVSRTTEFENAKWG